MTQLPKYELTNIFDEGLIRNAILHLIDSVSPGRYHIAGRNYYTLTGKLPSFPRLPIKTKTWQPILCASPLPEVYPFSTESMGTSNR